MALRTPDLTRTNLVGSRMLIEPLETGGTVRYRGLVASSSKSGTTQRIIQSIAKFESPVRAHHLRVETPVFEEPINFDEVI